MKLFNAMSTIVAMVLGLSFTGLALADDDSDVDIDAAMSRISATANGGGVPGNNVINNCGSAFANASAEIETEQGVASTEVKIKLKNAAPNTHYTVWLRMKGQSHGNGFGGAPITGGGATPLGPSSTLGTYVNDWVDSVACGGLGPTGSFVARANGFYTDSNGKGKLKVTLDFPMVGGAYPFNRMSAATLAQAQCQNPGALASPTAVVDPREANVGPGGTPFLIRMVSHCTDNASHGVSPGAREPWFQYP